MDVSRAFSEDESWGSRGGADGERLQTGVVAHLLTAGPAPAPWSTTRTRSGSWRPASAASSWPGRAGSRPERPPSREGSVRCRPPRP